MDVHTGGNSTSPIPCDATAAEMKASLERIDSIASIDVSRSESTIVGGYTWTISFLEDSLGTHRGDLQEIQTVSFLSSGTKASPSIKIAEIRKGTYKKVQKIRTISGGASMDPLSTFKLRFNGESTGDILAIPVGGSTCLGATAAKQLITTSTEDTSAEGGDDTVSPLTTFIISYGAYKTNQITANSGTCQAKSFVIVNELMLLSPLKNVEVIGADSGLQDGGCVWTVSLLSIIGNPELFTGMSIFKCVIIPIKLY